MTSDCVLPILSSEQAIDRLRSGGVVAIPTDTVYGIAASLEHPSAIERLYEIKGRATTKAIPLLVSDPTMLTTLSAELDRRSLALVEQLWPGALTVVLRASAHVPNVVRRGLSTVGVRMPDHPVALEIIRGVGGVLAVTSANPSGEPESSSVAEVRASLGTRIDGVVDGDPLPTSRPSTVVDISGADVRVLRVGAIPTDRIRALTGEAGQS